MAESLNVRVSGAGPPLLLIHGFLGSAATWDQVLPALSAEHRCIAVDLPGHGLSPPLAKPGEYSMDSFVERVLRSLDSLEIGESAVLGYSLGGRIALHYADRHPERVTALVLESANPGLVGAQDRDSRALSDEALASRIEQNGLDEFVAFWEELPLFGSQKRAAVDVREAIRRQRLSTNPAAAAAILRNLSPGRLPSLWGRLPALPMPVLALAGELDHKYSDIVTRIAEVSPATERRVIVGAGHAVHTERPAEFAAVVLEFLRSLADQRYLAAPPKISP